MNISIVNVAAVAVTTKSDSAISNIGKRAYTSATYGTGKRCFIAG